MFTSPIVYESMDIYHLPTTISEAGQSELEAMEHFYVNGMQFSEEEFIIEDWENSIGLNSINSISVDAYPNPATSILNIGISLDNRADVRVTIDNGLGQEVYSYINNFSTGINSVSIDVKNFEAGMYFYTVSSGNFTTTKRFIIK